MTPINQSIVKAFALLKSFSSADEWLTTAELSRRANLPGASGYRLVQTLEKVGAVVRGARGRYRPGMLLVSLSQAVEVGAVLRDASDAILRDLSDRLELTVHMGVLEDGMVTYVAKHGRPSHFAAPTQVGAQLEAYCSGLGKVLLAGLPDAALERFLGDGAFVALTPFTITNKRALRAELARVRLQNYAVDQREILPEMHCIAVPIRNAEGATVAAISVSDRAERLEPHRRAKVLAELTSAARRISEKLYPAVGAPRPAARRRRA
jgi:DNA-binding IclR family transcriptional regulator